MFSFLSKRHALADISAVVAGVRSGFLKCLCSLIRFKLPLPFALAVSSTCEASQLEAFTSREQDRNYNENLCPPCHHLASGISATLVATFLQPSGLGNREAAFVLSYYSGTLVAKCDVLIFVC